MKNKLIKFFLSLFKAKRKEGTFKYNFNLDKDKDDSNDYIFKMDGTIPESYSLPINAIEFVKMQGNVGSCMSHGLCTTIEISHRLKHDSLDVPLSERYHYYYGRHEQGTFPALSGMTARNGLKVASNIGIAPERLCPYDTTKINDKPLSFADGFAHMWKISNYWRLIDVEDMKSAISNDFPVLLGIYVNPSFYCFSGIIDVKDNERLFGGHEVCLFSYDKDNFYGINSWGNTYKGTGLFKLPINYVNKYMIDAWIINL